MNDLKVFLVSYNTVKGSHPPPPLSFEKILLIYNAVQVLSFLCLNLKSSGDLIVRSVKIIVSHFNLPYFCKIIGLPIPLPLTILLLLNLGYILMTLVSIFCNSKFKKLQDWSLNCLCKLEQYTLKSEVIFLFSLAVGMDAIFEPQNCLLSAHSTNTDIQKFPRALGVALVAMSVIQYYWRIYIHISVSYDTETITTELRSNTSRVLRGALIPVISALAHLESPIGVFVCVGVHLLAELFLLLGLGTHSNIKLNYFTLWVTIIQLPIYAILMLPVWLNPRSLLKGDYSQRSIGIFLLAPLIVKLILNMDKRRLNFLSQRTAECLTDKKRQLSWLEMTQMDLFLRQIFSTFSNLKEEGPEIYQIIEAILQSKKNEDPTFLARIEDNLIRDDQTTHPADFYIKHGLRPNFYEFINSAYSSILSNARKGVSSPNIECYLSYIAFHKDVTTNYGKAFIILAQLQKFLGTSLTVRAAASIELIECDLQKRIAGSGTQKTISAEHLFSFLDRSEKVQSSIENYVSEAFSFYEMLQKPIVSTKDIKNKGKKLLNERTVIIKELDSLIKINEYHQQTLLLYEFFLSEIVEEKAEGRFFQIKSKIDIFHVAEYYTLYRQQMIDGNSTDLELHGWDMSIEFFANQLDNISDYSVVVFNLNPEYLGKIMKCSTNLFQILGTETQDARQMNISNMEVTLFNPKNLKTLQEKILKGETDLKCLAGEDRTLYLKHENGCLIACTFVADVEIYGKDPCITCYMRKKKIHEQEFILFSLECEAKFVGISRGLCKGITKNKTGHHNYRSGSDFFKAKVGFNDESLDIIELVPSLKEILPTIENSPMWSESQVLLTIPNVPQLSMLQGSFIISYIGKVQEISVLKQRLGVIEIQSYFPTSIHKYDRLTTLSALSSLSKKNSLAKSISLSYNVNMKYRSSSFIKERKDRIDVMEIKVEKDEIDEDETNINLSQEIATPLKIPKSSRFPDDYDDEKDISQPFDDNYLVPQEQKELLQLIKGETPTPSVEPGHRNGEESPHKSKSVIVRKSLRSQRSEVELSSPLRISPGLRSEKVDETAQDYLSESSDKEAERERARQRAQFLKMAIDDGLTDGKASSIGSSLGAHLGYLRSLILENKTPGVLKAVNLFGVIIFLTTVASMLVTYFILSGRYNTFSLFAQSASFPGFIRAAASSLMISSEYKVSAAFFPAALQPAWQNVASQYSIVLWKIYLVQYYQFVLNFNLPFINEDIVSKSMYGTFYDFSQMNRNLSFYEANDIFNAYAYKMTQMDFYSPTMDPALLNFTRTFIPTFSNMVKEVSLENFESIYSLYDSTMTTLDVIMGIGIVVSVLLMMIFLPIYWRYEKMETIAFTKLCGVSSRELDPHLRKIIFSYERMFCKTLPAVKILQGNLSHYKVVKPHTNSTAPSAKVRTRRAFTKIAVSEKHSNLFVIILVLFVSVLLSAAYIVINGIFKHATATVLPFITDLEKMSNGLPSYFTIQSVLQRLFNELFNPQIKTTLPGLFEQFEGAINESIITQKEMNQYLLNELPRLETSDILSNTSKEFFHNFTKNTFCELFADVDGRYYSLCKIGLNNIVDTGYLAMGNHLMDIFKQQIQNFKTNPSLATMSAFYHTSDISEFMVMNMVAEYYLLQVLLSVQTDVANYSQKLLSHTYVMLGLSLAYNIGLLILLWIPTITYLRNRFKTSRSIFLLLPTKVLQHNHGIRNLFKSW